MAAPRVSEELLAGTNTENADLYERLVELEKRKSPNARAQDQVRDLTGMNPTQSPQADRTTLDDKLSDISRGQESLRSLILELKSGGPTSGSIIANVGGEKSIVEGQLVILKRQHSEMIETTATTTSEIAKYTAQLKEEISDLESTKTSSRAELTASRAEREVIRRDITEGRATNTSLSVEHEKLSNQVSQGHIDRTEVEAIVAELRQEVEDLKAEKRDLNNEHVNTEQELEEMGKLLDDKKGEETALITSIADLRREYGDLNTMREELTRLREELGSLRPAPVTPGPARDDTFEESDESDQSPERAGGGSSTSHTGTVRFENLPQRPAAPLRRAQSTQTLRPAAAAAQAQVSTGGSMRIRRGGPITYVGRHSGFSSATRATEASSAKRVEAGPSSATRGTEASSAKRAVRTPTLDVATANTAPAFKRHKPSGAASGARASAGTQDLEPTRAEAISDVAHKVRTPIRDVETMEEREFVDVMSLEGPIPEMVMGLYSELYDSVATHKMEWTEGNRTDRNKKVYCIRSRVSHQSNEANVGPYACHSCQDKGSLCVASWADGQDLPVLWPLPPTLRASKDLNNPGRYRIAENKKAKK